ncbi:hypothetical protein OPKNFCMD_0932 [Methylobacterium crusticola]|uniref:DUF308 domain-containing protein n=1 Tax=Methylobacterium crusticola TaxID=1697972 RepID=A0ABQ4QU61_9HYPH|nr:hypothetical protein [Methylobacterium crusticola]GJD48216.1 hypothetical protein OPKNFCMD_0932 [Methylobacterium crusticola]
MIVALFVLALAMLLGGLAALLQGIPFVRLEIGWTMVIAGTVAASGGAVLLGLTAVVARLGRIERVLAAAGAGARGGRSEPALPGLPAAPPRMPDPISASPAVPAHTLPETAALAVPPVAAALAGAGLAPGELRPTRAPEPEGADEPGPHAPGAEPARVEPAHAAHVHAEHAHAEHVRAEGPQTAPAPPAPPGPADSHEASAPLEAISGPRDFDPHLPPADRASHAGEAPPAEPGSEAAGPAEPAGHEGEGEPATVVGTYASGGNTYAMYSDGTIEAETPAGRFRFQSIEDFKAFIAAGGEGGEPLRSGAA